MSTRTERPNTPSPASGSVEVRSAGSGQNVCPMCSGNGKRDGKICPNCGGTGKIGEAPER